MKILATNILSPLGSTTEANYRAVRQGRTALASHAAGTRGVPFPFCAALFADGEPDFVSLCVESATEALSHAQIDKLRTVFILSTTKGVIGRNPGDVAKEISLRLGIENEPVVVCNACVSGVAAQVLAHRLLDCGFYDYAVITGADVQGSFIISGFHSLKALSPVPCRPFDIDRSGLNLGEAAATMVAGREDRAVVGEDAWHITAGAICNDAYHISNPHPRAEGAYKVLSELLTQADATELACLSVHGTGTMYNDQMESVAIERAALQHVPLSALKGYYGHTMGAAGLLETILTARALDDGIVLPSKGFEELGVSGKINISAKEITTTHQSFLKIISGFGGVNAGVAVTRKDAPVPAPAPSAPLSAPRPLRPLRCGFIATPSLTIQSRLPLVRNAVSRAVISEIDRLREQGGFHGPMHIVLFNMTSTAIVDKEFLETISDNDAYYPSPSIFVYTLPNIVTGEVAMRYGWQVETSFYVLRERNEQMIHEIVNATAQAHPGERILYGWMDRPEKNKIELELYIKE
ncbi:MAG: 3-oxoacyl-ACP synthase [Prevotella sp.]|nr:3-oxoacyl-ACP synthase [Prevotella sp.]